MEIRPAANRVRSLVGDTLSTMSSRPLRIEPARLSWGGLTVALIGAGVLVYHLTRTTTLWFDEWIWALERRAGGLDSLLRPHNGHFSLVPVAIYKLLFATAGITSSGPYRIVMIVCELGCALLFYAYARRRVGDFVSLLAAGVILSLGPGWQDILWPFQIAWLISIAAGIGALLALDRHDRRGDLAACVLLVLSLASSSVGVAIALGTVVEVAWGRRRWRDGWIVIVPLVLYALWSVGYQNTSANTDVVQAGRFVADSFAASLSTPLGLARTSVANQTGTIPEFGFPLAVVALALVIWRSRHGVWSARAAALAAMLASFWILIALTRSGIGIVSPYSSRYLYVDCVFALLVAIELARRVRVTKALGVALTVIAAAAAISNLGSLRDGAAYLRNSALLAKADLGALDLGRQIIPASYTATSFPGYPFVVVKAGAYFTMARAIGTPAFTLAQLAAAPEGAREAADSELARIDAIAPRYGSRSKPSGPPPVIEQSSGELSKRGSCVALAPLVRPSDAAPSVARVELTLAPKGVRISLGGSEALVEARRFAHTFQPLGSLRARTSATVRARPDEASARWQLEIVTGGPIKVCS